MISYRQKSVGTFLTNWFGFVITPWFHSCRTTNTQISCGSQVLIFFHSFIQSSIFNDATYFLLKTPPHTQATQNIYSPPPRPHFVCAFKKNKKLELQIIWSTKIIGMEFSASKAMMRTALLNYYFLCLWSFFWVVKNSKNWLNISLICKKNYLQNSCFPQKTSPINWVRQSCDKFLGGARSSPHPKGIALFGWTH